MKKNLIRTNMLFLLTVSLMMIVMAAYTSQVYAGTYRGPTLKEGESTPLIYQMSYDNDAVTFLKIKPSKTGTITFTADYVCSVTLCDSKEKEISKGNLDHGDPVRPGTENEKVHYGVKKGTTYYLKIRNMPTAQDSNGYYTGKVKYTCSKVSPSKSGASKKKAKAIKKKKTVKGIFTAGKKKAQWYKITNKQKKTTISLSTPRINYALKFKIYYKSAGKWYDQTFTLTSSPSANKNTIEGTVNIKAKHTYYIKVYPDGKSSGYYTIKWK